MKFAELHLINVRLPLLSISELYELEIVDGRFVSIQNQQHRKIEESFRPINDWIEESQTEPALLDLEGRILLPGFVDSHMHLDKAFSLPMVPNPSGTLREAVRRYIDASPSFSKEGIKERMVKGVLKALSYGTLHIRTHIDFHPSQGKEIAWRGIEAALKVKEMFHPYLDIQVYPMCPYQLSCYDVDCMEEVLRLGVDGLGGAPHLSDNPTENINEIFRMAMNFDKNLDLHVDENDDPQVCTLAYIIEQVKRMGYQGRVAVGHLCSMAAMREGQVQQLIDGMLETDMGAITLPGSNLYLQGRGDQGIIRRGITRVRELLQEGVLLATASDNIYDPFHPFGLGELFQIAMLTGYAAHLGSSEDMGKLLEMITVAPAKLVGIQDYGFKVGNEARFVILDAYSVEELLALLPEKRWVYRGSQWVSISDFAVRFGKGVGDVRSDHT